MAVKEKERKIFPTKLKTCDNSEHIVYIEYDQELKQTLYFRDPEGEHIFWPDGTMETAKKTIEGELLLRPVNNDSDKSAVSVSKASVSSSDKALENSEEYVKTYTVLFMLTKANQKKKMSLKINGKSYSLEMEKDENGKVKSCVLNLM